MTETAGFDTINPEEYIENGMKKLDDDSAQKQKKKNLKNRSAVKDDSPTPDEIAKDEEMKKQIDELVKDVSDKLNQNVEDVVQEMVKAVNEDNTKRIGSN